MFPKTCSKLANSARHRGLGTKVIFTVVMDGVFVECIRAFNVPDKKGRSCTALAGSSAVVQVPAATEVFGVVLQSLSTEKNSALGFVRSPEAVSAARSEIKTSEAKSAEAPECYQAWPRTEASLRRIPVSYIRWSESLADPV